MLPRPFKWAVLVMPIQPKPMSKGGIELRKRFWTIRDTLVCRQGGRCRSAGVSLVQAVLWSR